MSSYSLLISIKPKALGLWRLLRIMPVLASSASAFILGIGLAAGYPGHSWLNGLNIGIIILAGTILHGITAHACNDLEDWRSGTDRSSQGILSGGSGVIKEGLLNEGSILLAGLFGLVLAVGAGIYFSSFRGPFVLVFLLVGAWSALSYTLPPFRLAYRPFLGEWLAMFPAFISCTAGSFYIFTGSLTREVVTAGILHGILTVGWIMQHHLPDIPADLQASPRKITTPAMFCEKWGYSAARLVPVFYYLFAVVISLAAGIFLNPVFLLTVFPAAICIYLAASTDALDIQSITYREKWMICISTGHAAALAFVLGVFC